MRIFAIKLCLLVMSEVILISPTSMTAHKDKLNKDDTKVHA